MNGAEVMGGIGYRLIAVEITGWRVVGVKFFGDVSDRLIVRISASFASPLVQTVVSPFHSSRGGPGKDSAAFL